MSVQNNKLMILLLLTVSFFFRDIGNTVLTQIGRRKMMIRVFTVCYCDFSIKNSITTKKKYIIPNTPKIENSLDRLIRMGKSTWLIWVKVGKWKNASDLCKFAFFPIKSSITLLMSS